MIKKKIAEKGVSMGFFEALSMLWTMPWYKLLFIGGIVEVMVLVKLWPLWLFLIGGAVVLAWFHSS